MAAPQLFNRVRTEGQVDMKNGRLTQWIAKYGYVPIVLMGMVGLAPEIGAGERKSGDTIVVEAPVVAEPASKGYIMYTNSPAHWTPVPLPDEINSARATHNNNIRAEIEQAAMLFDVDVRMMKAFARIEFGYNPKATTGKYKCLFQLSDWEFAKYWHGDIYDIRDCSIAAARKIATEAAQFEKDIGRRATAAEIYCIHQQGYQGCAFHYAAPYQLAWKNMYLTAEVRRRARHGRARPSGATFRRTSKARSRAELRR